MALKWPPGIRNRSLSCDFRIIQLLLGHSSIRSTEIYTPLSEPLRDNLRQLLRQTTDGLFEGRRPKHG